MELYGLAAVVKLNDKIPEQIEPDDPVYGDPQRWGKIDIPVEQHKKLLIGIADLFDLKAVTLGIQRFDRVTRPQSVYGDFSDIPQLYGILVGNVKKDGLADPRIEDEIQFSAVDLQRDYNEVVDQLELYLFRPGPFRQ